MPYQTISELPAGVKNNLPEHAQEIYLAAYNHAVDEYEDPEKRRGDASVEEVARKVAWAAVEQVYEKNARTGKWVKRPKV
jgi:cation transport regulator